MVQQGPGAPGLAGCAVCRLASANLRSAASVRLLAVAGAAATCADLPRVVCHMAAGVGGAARLAAGWPGDLQPGRRRAIHVYSSRIASMAGCADLSSRDRSVGIRAMAGAAAICKCCSWVGGYFAA